MHKILKSRLLLGNLWYTVFNIYILANVATAIGDNILSQPLFSFAISSTVTLRNNYLHRSYVPADVRNPYSMCMFLRFLWCHGTEQV